MATVEFLGKRLTDASSATDWDVDRVDGGGGQSWGSVAVNTTESVQGGSCISALSTANSNSKVVFFSYDVRNGVGQDLDFGVGGADEGQLLWIWCKLLAPQPSGDSVNLPGVSVGCASAGAGSPSNTDIAWWTFYGTENYSGSWVRLVLDPRKHPTVSGASFDISAISHVGMVGTTQTAKGAVEVAFMDAIDLGSGVRYYGTDADIDGFDDLILQDQDTTANVFGVVETLEATDTVVQIRGILEIGSGNAATAFTTNDKIITFDAPKYIVDPGAEFANALPDDFPKIIIKDTATGSTSGLFGTKVGTGDDAVGRNGLIFLANSEYNYNFIMESGVNFQLYGTTLKNFNNPLIWSGSSECELAGSFFDNNGQIEIPDVDTLLTNCTFLNASGDSSLLWTSGMNIKNCSFLGNVNVDTTDGAGIEHADTITAIYDNLTFSDNDYDIFFSPTSSGRLTINATNGANPLITKILRGNVNSFVSIINTITLTLTDLQVDSEIRIYEAGTQIEVDGTESSSTSFVYSFEGGDPNVDIRIFHLDYQPVNFFDRALPASNAELLIQQIFDRNYENP